MINQTALRHPSTQWSLEAAHWRALETGRAIVTAKLGDTVSAPRDLL